MKKILTLLFLIVGISTFAQEKTLNALFIKTKIGHGGLFHAADEAWFNKYKPVNDNNPHIVFDVMGGIHNSEILTIFNIGKSFADRDADSSPIDGKWENFNVNVSPHIESMTADLIIYKEEYSNSSLADKADKFMNTVYEIKGIGSNKVLTDVMKKLPKVWDKLGWKIASFTTTTGTYRLIQSRRLPNGWKELDDTTADFPSAYDLIYGKGSFDRDIIVLSTWMTRIDKYMLTKNNALSSK
jgi:hypothetical protein